MKENFKDKNIDYQFITYSRGLARTQNVLLTHGDSLDRLCDNFKTSAKSSNDIVAGIFNEQLRIYGVQFHPEVDLTQNGKQMLSNFLFEIARVSPNYTMQNRKDECIKYIKEKVGSNKVLVSYNFFLQNLFIYLEDC